MFKDILQKIDAFNDLKGCKGKYTLIDKDGEMIFTTPTESVSMATYKDKETYLIRLEKPNKECRFGSAICIEGLISAGYDEATNNMRIQYIIEFIDSVEGPSLFKC
jgi:hypothetical protein